MRTQLQVTSHELGLVLAHMKLAAPKQQEPQWVIRTRAGEIVESLSGKTRFPSRSAASCALSHTLMAVLRNDSDLDRVDLASRELARRNGSPGPKQSKIVLDAVLASGAVRVEQE